MKSKIKIIKDLFFKRIYVFEHFTGIVAVKPSSSKLLIFSSTETQREVCILNNGRIIYIDNKYFLKGTNEKKI
jgi:hypothetical protein